MENGQSTLSGDTGRDRHGSSLPLSSTKEVENNNGSEAYTTSRGSVHYFGDRDVIDDYHSAHHNSTNIPGSEAHQTPSVPTSPHNPNREFVCPSVEESNSADYFTTPLSHYTDLTSIVNLNTPSNLTSPLQSAYASSTSLHSSQVGSAPTDEDYSGDTLSFRTRAVLEPSPRSSISCPTTPGHPAEIVVKAPAQRSIPSRQDGPRYPDQSFAALQPQFHPPSYQPNPLRPKASHLSSASGHSSGSSKRSHDRSSTTAGTRTVGNTPAGSPGLFPDAYMRNKVSGDESEEARFNPPLLHPNRLQAPKETHKLLKDIDPISGRKIINNYEFYGKLGSGAHGTVKLGRDLVINELVAVKIVRRFSKKVRLGKQETPEDKVKKEVAVLKKARHPHVVSLLEVIDDPEFGKVYLILEYVELGEIIWRKPAEKTVAGFEMDRMKREKAGNVDKEAEMKMIASFNDDASARLAEREKMLSERTISEDEHSATENEPISTIGDDSIVARLWSLEHDNEAVDEVQKHRASEVDPNTHPAESDSPFMPSIAERFHTYDDFPSPSSLTSQELFGAVSSEIEHNDSFVTDLRSMHPSKLEGTMWGAYAAELDYPHTSDTVFQSTPRQTVTQHADWTEEEEEFSHVPCLTLAQALEAFRDTVLGLEYLHFQGIIHRDIKPANLLWTKDYRVKISDFGVSYLGRPIREDDNNEEIEEADATNLDEAIELAKTVGTPAFYAPELCDPDLFDSSKNLEKPQITGQIDVWALGVTLYCMVFGRLPFFDVNEFSMYEKIARQKVFIPSMRLRGVEDDTTAPRNGDKRADEILEYEVVDDELRDLLRRLLEKPPLKRITLKEVKHHPWVLRGVGDQAAWIDDTDPSVQSQGKKIEVSSQEVSEAVAPITVMERIKSGFRRLGSVVRGRDSRKRAESSVKAFDGDSNEHSVGSTDDREGRRASIRGDEQIFSALRASRENTEHPLAYSVVASPELEEHFSYFAASPEAPTNYLPPPSDAAFSVRRPTPPGRTSSTTESMRTIKAQVPTNVLQEAISPGSDGLPIPQSTPVIEKNASSGLSGIFGGAGRRFVNNMRSRERGRGCDSTNASHSSRSSSIDNMASTSEDPHASPSIALSSALAAGQVNQPPVLREAFETKSRPQSVTFDSSVVVEEKTVEPLQQVKGRNHRRDVSGTRLAIIEKRPLSGVNSTLEAPPSPEDGGFHSKPQRPPSQDAAMVMSSSDDHMTSGISESFSHPSIPSVISGTSSLSNVADGHHVVKQDWSDVSLMSNKQQIKSSLARRSSNSQNPNATEDDEAGYNGDGDGNGEEDESDDEGICFGKKA